jgi:thiol-disulfide isomerase/thioredoxin
MKQFCFVLPALLFTCLLHSQPSANKQTILYGQIERIDLSKEPHSRWYDSAYKAYQPEKKMIETIRKVNTNDITIEAFFGSWCGDSKREMPRMLKVFDLSGIAPSQVLLIAVGDGDSLYKQSPGHQEKSKGIFRVPTFIIYKKGKEIGRVNEFPVLSAERDLSAILTEGKYEPNYKTFELVHQWLEDGTLTNKNASTRGLAMQLKWLASGESELNSLGYLLLKHNKIAEALRLFQVNANLYPESANVISSLGEGYLKNGDTKNAIIQLERSLELNKDPQLVKEILQLLYEAKGLKG